MSSFFGSDPFHDPRLGELNRRRGRWVGSMELAPHGAIEVRLAGSRKSPDRDALDTALALPANYAALRLQIATALFEHYEPGWEAWRSGELEGMVDSFPELKGADDVWSNVRVEYADIEPARREFPVEVRLTVTWDEEHTLGVRMDGARLVELCGSVGP